MAQIRDISKRTALYERLSKDDEQQGESNSILNQKQYLEEYAHKNGFVNIQHFTDDGYTGRNFNRPGFQEMLAEIENGKIGTVIVKDMSRFGRNYLQVGFYTEMMFPQKQVRFIAINNSVDSDKPQDNDFTPFLNIMNEWYAKDTSNKIKSIFLSRMNDGKRCSGSIPYGYNRLPGDKQTLVVDPVASKVVKHIFALAADGYNPPTIAKKLTEEEVLIPSAYTLQYHPEQCNRKSEWGCTRWNPTTVREILERQEYLGHTVLRKTIGTNFKTDARRSSTDEEMEKIHYPRFLYKYRAVNNNNLDALRSNKLFFSKASSYDDPFDTFLHIDVDKIRQEFNSNYSSPEALAALANGMKETFQNQPGIPQEFIQQVTNVEGLKQLFANGITKQFLSYVLTLRSKIQDEILSICFSENGFNETLWLKYADTHKGFCLMYDLSDADSSHCGKLDKCVNCGVYKYGTRIYPVYYSNTPHDATNFAKFVMGQDMMQQLHVPLPDFMQEELKPLPWEVERNSLIKKECHKYDEEWRMLANCKMNLPSMIEYVPAGVIIGLRTPPVDKNLIISMAKEAGVKNIYQSYIDEKNRLNAYLLKDV